MSAPAAHNGHNISGMKRLGKYEVGRKLGSGNFSLVRLAVDTTTGREYAIKIIDKEQLVHQKMEEQLRREITLMRRLNHPNIVRLLDVMQTENHIYLVTELASGGELFGRIVQEKKFTDPMARHYFRQLICGLDYCHQHGIAHRDLKPENLLLDSNGTLKISDFGLSNMQLVGGAGPGGANTFANDFFNGYGHSDNSNSLSNSSNMSGNGVNGYVASSARPLLQTVCGTPNYIAPEVLKERGYDGLKADIWSCGVVLFVMLAGYLPFNDSTLNALFMKIERGQFQMSRSFTPEARDLIGRMLIVDPFHRITLDRIQRHPWFVL